MADKNRERILAEIRLAAESNNNDFDILKMQERILAELAIIKSYTMLAAKNVLTISDVSLMTGISKSTLYRLTCEKKIPHYKPNAKLLFFDRAEIEAWAKQNPVSVEH